jgi:hypothetical protein
MLTSHVGFCRRRNRHELLKLPHPRNWRRVRNFGLRRSAAIAGPLTGGEMRFGPGRENT